MTKYVWPFALTCMGVLLGIALLCIAPFVAVGTFAVRTLSLRAALAVVGAMWLAGQVIGFAFFHYPHHASTYILALSIGVAALAATLVAGRIRVTALAFLAAFAVYELVLYAFSLVAGGREEFGAAILAEMLEGNLLGVAIIGLIRLVLVRSSAAFGPRGSTRPV